MLAEEAARRRRKHPIHTANQEPTPGKQIYIRAHFFIHFLAHFPHPGRWKVFGQVFGQVYSGIRVLFCILLTIFACPFGYSGDHRIRARPICNVDTHESGSTHWQRGHTRIRLDPFATWSKHTPGLLLHGFCHRNMPLPSTANHSGKNPIRSIRAFGYSGEIAHSGPNGPFGPE